MTEIIEVKQLGVRNPRTLKLFEKIQSLSCLRYNGLDIECGKKD